MSELQAIGIAMGVLLLLYCPTIMYGVQREKELVRAWNTRPLEEKLQAEKAELLNIVDRLESSLNCYIKNSLSNTYDQPSYDLCKQAKQLLNKYSEGE